MLAVMTVGAALFSFSALITGIAASFDIEVARAAAVPGVYGVTLAFMAPAIGLFAQRLPRATLIVGGLLVYATAWAGAVVADGFGVLLMLTAVAGVGTGAVLPTSYAYAADLAGPDDRARVMGRIVGGWSLAILVLVPVMGVVAQWVGWRWAFGVLAASGYGCALALLMAVRRSRGVPHPVQTGVPTGIVAAVRDVLSDGPTLVVLATNLIEMGAFYSVFTFAGSEMVRAGGAGTSTAGFALAAYGGGLLIAGLSARVIDRWGRRRAGIGALFVLVGVLTTLPLLADAPLVMAAGILVWGVVQGTFFTAITTLATEILPHRRGVVTALLGASTYVGVTLYTPVSSWLYASHGYFAVGVAAAVGCAAAALLLSRLPHARDG